MILVDGEPSEGIPISDSVVQRGDGVFEALRTAAGRPFALEEHLDRLERSAAAMDLEVVDRELLRSWVDRAAEPVGHALVRILVTRGDNGTGGRTVVLSEPLPMVPEPFSVLPHRAPWHPAGRPWELAGVKTLSYAPNLAASRIARRTGYSDALLVSDDDTILEGPTFCIGSIGVGVVEGRFHLDRLEKATDVIAMSTVKQVTNVTRCGDLEPQATEFTDRLREAFAALYAGTG